MLEVALLDCCLTGKILLVPIMIMLCVSVEVAVRLSISV